MEWIESILIDHSALQAVIVLSIICAVGLSLGKIKVLGVSLGATLVFFVGILAGHLGLSLDADMLNYAENFGLILFVYALGLQVGPGFFSSFRKGGLTLNMLAMAVIMLGIVITVIAAFLTGIPITDMVGVMCGAVTNTPALGAAQQTLKQLGIDSSSLALGCAVAYPLGVVGVILALVVSRKIFYRNNDKLRPTEEHDETFIAAFKIQNPAIFGKSLKGIDILKGHHFIITRLWRGDNEVSIPTSETVLEEGDRILVVTNEKDVAALEVLFGEQESTDWNKRDIDWNKVDSHLVSQKILITKPELNGKRLGSLHLRNDYGVNTTRVYRGGISILASPQLRLQLGDRLIVVGEAKAVKEVSEMMGNTVKNLGEPNLVSVFIGLTIGLILGSIPIMIPGVSMPVKLGLAGGPIIVGILMGTFGPRLHMVTYVTRSANLMLRALGLSLYLACLGIDAGSDFFDIVIRPEGMAWIGIGFVITIVPVLIVGFIASRIMKMDYATVGGMLCGSMANPMALNYANDVVGNDAPAVAYTTVYPLSMFVRVIIVQVLLICMC
ncbi:MAG: putative transporter [Muribaculaceae bacterium]|nr:putative transporter [Muribaculaceae bacterium]